MAKERPASNFQTEVIKIYRDVEDGETGTQIAIVRYIKDGTAYAPQLVCREMYTDRLTRQRKIGKTKGWRWGDVKYIEKNLPEILEILTDVQGKRQKPPEERLPYSDGPKEERDPFADEEVPF